MKKLVFCLSFCAVLAWAASGLAEITPGAFSLSPFIGGYTFDGVQHTETRPVYGVRGGYDFTAHFGAEAVFDFGATTSTQQGGDLDVYNYRLDLLYHILPEHRLVPYVAAGFGGITIDAPARTTSKGVFNYGGGVKYFLTDTLALRGDVRHLVYYTDQTLNNVEYTVGLSFLFGGQRPAPQPAAPPTEPAAVPPPAPTSTLSLHPATVNRGETTALVWTSQNAANCDIQPGIGPVQPHGSMNITPAAGTTYTLTCSGAGGTTTSTATANVRTPKKERVCIVLEIEFDTGKAVIKPRYHDEIARVAQFMHKYPEANGVIEGHTDNVGGYEENMKLSEERAQSVRSYLIEKFGIAPQRLAAKGYGYTRPIADNATSEGRQKNRRIEANFDCVVTTVQP